MPENPDSSASIPEPEKAWQLWNGRLRTYNVSDHREHVHWPLKQPEDEA